MLPRSLVFTPGAAVGRLLRWPHVQMTGGIVDSAAQIVCAAAVERELLCESFPAAAGTWWRMTLAARLLRAGDQSLSAIAERIGYGNEYAFSKAFRRELGMAPSHYRAQAQPAGDR